VNFSIDATAGYQFSFSAFKRAGHQESICDPRLLKLFDTFLRVPNRQTPLLIRRGKLIDEMLILIKCHTVNGNCRFLRRGALLARTGRPTSSRTILVVESLFREHLKSLRNRNLMRTHLLQSSLHIVLVNLFLYISYLLPDLIQTYLLHASSFHFKYIFKYNL
jgi:hypothetical protein